MPGPFPGMDPFLENSWGDVHASLSLYARDALQPQLPADLVARVEEYLGIAGPDAERGRAQPDVRVAESAKPPRRGGGTAVLEAVEVEASPRVLVSRYVELPTLRRVVVMEKQGGRVVTAVEFLSPFNKLTAAERRAFRDKQRRLLDGGVNLVEIDLLCRGRWTVSVPERETPPEAAYPYRVCVVRADAPEDAEMYPTDLRRPLPTIAVPLRLGDQDVTLALQPLLETTWRNGRYDTIDRRPEDLPPLKAEDSEWILGLLRSHDGSRQP